MERMKAAGPVEEVLGDAHRAVMARVLDEEEAQREHVVVYLSGAHAYGFPSPDSDLDLVLSAELPVARTDAARLHTDLSKLPVRIDLLLETPRGAAVLAEYGRGVDVILLRSAQGPRLVRDPWNTDDSRVATP